MAERMSVNKGAQIGAESVPGTGVAANKALQLLDLDFAAEFDTKAFTGNGRQFVNTVRRNKDWTSGKWDMKSNEGTPAASYSELVYPWSAVHGAATITTPGGGTISRQWAWDVALTGPTTAKTFTVEQGDSVRAHKAAYVLPTGWNLKADREGVGASGNFIAQALSDGISMTNAPTLLPITPILGADWTLYRDSTSGGIGGTALSRVYSVELDYPDIYAASWPGNQAAATNSFATHVQVAPKPVLKITQQADTTGMTGLADIRAGTTEYFRFQCVGALIEGAINQKLIIDCAAQYADKIEIKDGDDVVEVTYILTIVEDTTWTHAMLLKLINTLTAL
jgi:hypothetical protein